jgi:hypothetical protein
VRVEPLDHLLQQLPMYEKFETELQEPKAREDARARARRRLMAYSDAGALKAIR